MSENITIAQEKFVKATLEGDTVSYTASMNATEQFNTLITALKVAWASLDDQSRANMNYYAFTRMVGNTLLTGVSVGDVVVTQEEVVAQQEAYADALVAEKSKQIEQRRADLHQQYLADQAAAEHNYQSQLDALEAENQ